MMPSTDISTFVFEMTPQCNHNCVHCYNFWRRKGSDYPQEILSTPDTLDMLDKMLSQTGVRQVALSGGEPMLRADIYDIAHHLRKRGVGVTLITNGSLITAEAVERLGDAVGLYEIPLLSDRREMHDIMSARTGAFDDATMAIALAKSAGKRVVAVFVATALNIDNWQGAAEVAFALGVDGIMFNRHNPGGAGGQSVTRLMPPLEKVTAALDFADTVREKWGVSVSCSIAMHPCLFDHSRWPSLGFGFCAAGTDRAYYALDWQGNIRPCNHSSTVLGNIRQDDFSQIIARPAMQNFMQAAPEFCGDCKMVQQCQGGCKAAAEICCGDFCAVEPYLAANMNSARKPS
jgi:radical SAM protein with 4Fe4S-binding SPASM domain